MPLDGDLYVYDLARTPADAVRRLTSTARATKPTRASRRAGTYVSFVRDQNLYVIELANGTERAITREGGGLVSFGLAEFIAQEEMDRDTGYWWSPDERHIALARVDESPVAEIERFEIQATGVRVVQQRYPATGAANAQVELFVADVAAETRIPLDLGTVRGHLSTTRRVVSGQPRPRRAEAEPRPTTLDLLRFDAFTGRAHVLLTERSDSWVALNNELMFLQRSAGVHLGLGARRLPAPVSIRERRHARCARSRRASSWCSATAADAR